MSGRSPWTRRPDVPFVIPAIIPRRGVWSVGSVDPTLYLNFDQDELYQLTDDHIGRLWFRVRFLAKDGKLEVLVMKAKNLYSKARRYSNQACSACISVELPPLCNQACQTKVRRNANDQDINETFLFDVERPFLRKCTLHLTARDTWPDGRQRVIGHAAYTMRELGRANADSGQPVTMWRDLSPTFNGPELGVGLVSLSLSYYAELERLVVTLHEVRQAKDCQNKDVSVQLTRHQPDGRVAELKQSSLRLCDPAGSARLNESFQFRLAREQRREARICLTLGCGVARHPVGWVGVGDRRLNGCGFCGDPEAAELLREAVTGESARLARPVSAWLTIVASSPGD